MPIVNVPSADKLTDFSLVLYFAAWERLKDIYEAFDMSYEGGANSWPNEWNDYLEASRSDFEAIINLAAQSAEIAMKGMLCSVSPYLLLLGQDTSFKRSSIQIDFTDLRTIDAVDLPNVVNTFCASTLSDRFIRIFDELRKLRNKSMHLGASTTSVTVEYVIDALVNIYVDLWPDKKWLSEWVRTASKGRYSFFHDGSSGSAHAVVLDNLNVVVDLLTKGQFLKLFGKEKSKRKYYCFQCLEDARLDWSEWERLENTKTAYLTADNDSIECLMCGGTYPVVREKCGQDSCLGDVVAPEDAGYRYHCYSCCRSTD